MQKAIRLAIVGAGKIVVDQHLPALARDPSFELVAMVDPRGSEADVPCFPTLDALLTSNLVVEAAVIATPPQVREGVAVCALNAGLHVFLEKPPATTLSGARRMLAYCAQRQTLFAAWHSREAPMVDVARQWLEGRSITGGVIQWREDAHQWHPGQRWLWQPGGFGIFDPAINGFSILTAISTEHFSVAEAIFEMPVNQHAPIAVKGTLSSGHAAISLDLDFREKHQQSWLIELTTADGGRMQLTDGGRSVSFDNASPLTGESQEYSRLYAKFARLIESGEREMDIRPLELVADAFLLAKQNPAPEFHP